MYVQVALDSVNRFFQKPHKQTQFQNICNIYKNNVSVTVTDFRERF